MVNVGCPAQINDSSISIKPYLNSITVSNLDSTIMWYHNNLGFNLTKKTEMPEYSLRIAFMELDNFHLELIEFKEFVSYSEIKNYFKIISDRAKIQGFFKLGFLVDNLQKITERLKRNSVKFERNITQDKELGVKFILVDDNNGNAIQLFQFIN
jgi:catechol 2,3-dioxygenase-like lactoylglutathione lyase family enzyme